MTYCVALRMNKGLVFLSDTRTNAGVDNISTFRKMFTWEDAGDRMITMMTAGNLATTQAVVSILDERTKAPADRAPSILQAPSMFQVAKLVGDTLAEVVRNSSPDGQSADAFGATIIVGGQIGDSPPRLFLVYPEGNFIEASDDTSFFQIGETKYGRPILVRAFDPEMSFEDAVKLLLVSFDSTMKANLSVGLPIDVQIYEANSLKRGRDIRMGADDEYYSMISNSWGEALRSTFYSLPTYTFDD
jgi:putative proteasome-type protease